LIQDLQGFSNLGGLESGDVIITNHPAFGGSHLPDITVVTPVFYDNKRIGFTASRAHHAEIGGKSPGSMPADARNLAEEGVVIPPMLIVKKGRSLLEQFRKLLEQAPYPSRTPDENLADIEAAIAANNFGASELQKLADVHSPEIVQDYMIKLRRYAGSRLENTLQNIPDGMYQASEKMDDGSLLKVSCDVIDNEVTIDFTGSAEVHPGNLNANPSIVNSVVMYVLRLLIHEPLPLNDGLLDPVKLIIPEGILNPRFPDDPVECPAVVGGNIETSQRLTDTLLKAFEKIACSQGTMNNVLFGNKKFGYYETVGGGSGAGEGFHGTDAVHHHMTNTRATDPEILEHRYPVRLDKLAIRKNSGGAGKWKGGDGIIKKFTFLEPVQLTVLTQHRNNPPYGLNGGRPGKTGKQWVERVNGKIMKLDWQDSAELNPGDRFILQTPGGGGFGNKQP
ncbi:MAG: hydantoinase B/oxoprolinase family protein, partial [Balneolaceae bacterium]